jgi:hypothetical protein
MSSPMFDIPVHLAMPVNAKGQGPETDPALVAKVVCWCGDRWCRRELARFVVTLAGTVADTSSYPWTGEPCFICGDPDDHFALPHGEATGDGRVRLDWIFQPDVRKALHEATVMEGWFDSHFITRVLARLDGAGYRVVPK